MGVTVLHPHLSLLSYTAVLYFRDMTEYRIYPESQAFSHLPGMNKQKPQPPPFGMTDLQQKTAKP